MSRQGKTKKRAILPDLRFGSILVAKLINRAMREGKKSAAQKQVYDALDIIAKQTGQGSMTILTAAMENIKPQMEIRPRRIGGAAYQVPMPVKGERRESLAARWLIQYSRKRPNSQYHTFAEKLAAEILDAIKGEGGAVKKKQDVFRMAEANKAFAHFRW